MKIYIAGKIAGDDDYRVKFLRARVELEREGNIILTPAVLPDGMETGDYMKICFAMIDVADAVAFLPDWPESPGACLERQYCEYTGKKILSPWGEPEKRTLLEINGDNWIVRHVSYPPEGDHGRDAV